jgi:hypothetical protein
MKREPLGTQDSILKDTEMRGRTEEGVLADMLYDTLTPVCATDAHCGMRMRNTLKHTLSRHAPMHVPRLPDSDTRHPTERGHDKPRRSPTRPCP